MMNQTKTIRLTFLLLILFVFSSPLFARTSQYRLGWREDPATSMVIGWTQKGGRDAFVAWGEEDFGREWKSYPNQTEPQRKTRYGAIKSSFVRLTGLQPDTAYYFVVKDSNSASRRMWFKTAPAVPQKISFIAGGDSRNNPEGRRLGNRLVAKLRPLFVLFGGDYTGEGLPGQWRKWLNDWQKTISEDGRIYPILAAMGNHEDSDMEMVWKLFDTPNPDCISSLAFGGDMMRIWTLNTELGPFPERKAAMNSWFAEDLAAHRGVNWKIVDYHKPMRPHYSKKAEGLTQIADWSQLFFEHGVDLVVESDTHMVKRTWPIRPSEDEGSYESFIRDDEKGTVFIGEGTWGAPMRTADDAKPWTRATDSFYQFKWIHVSPEKLESRVVRFENVDGVKPVSDENPFAVPAGIKLWEPEHGAVMTLPARLEK